MYTTTPYNDDFDTREKSINYSKTYDFKYFLKIPLVTFGIYLMDVFPNKYLLTTVYK